MAAAFLNRWIGHSKCQRFSHVFTNSYRTAKCRKGQESYMIKTLCSSSTIGNGIFFRNVAISSALSKKNRVNITFVKPDGQKLTGTGIEGETLLDIVVKNDLDIKGYGACEGTLSCSTCHVIFKEEDYNKLEEKAFDEENDMLDLALCVSPTSRLGCQVTVTKDMDGLEVMVPSDVKDARGT